MAIACGLLSSPYLVNAQSDNFDSYSTTAELTAAGWILTSLNPALVTTTFPTVGAGKGLRLQANPFSPYPAVGGWYRTNDYTDFYMALDIVNWQGTTKNQAVVLFGRLTSATTGTVLPDQNPADAQGVICNYDTSQYGENPGDRRQGQFQINLVSANPPFTTTTLAVSEMTLEPGRSYRIIFTGTGIHYTGQLYDMNDLTTPLVTIQADDQLIGYTHGACGILAFQRSSGTVDITIDNYYAGTTDPNLATPPALSHPIPDTPVVATRTPAERWKNFLNPASGLSFTAKTYSANVINAAATQLRLNGADVSSQLSMSANGASISGSLPGAALTANKLYSAELVVTDVAGTKSSTNTFWFDTFSDAYLLSPAVKVIEAEEYNYTNGGYQLDPIPVSGVDTNGLQINGYGVGYYDGGTGETTGGAEVDYHSHNGGPDKWSMFRILDAVKTVQGLVGVYYTTTNGAVNQLETDPGSDNIRSQHSASNLLEYVVGRTVLGDWQNYTRSFSSAFYVAYLRYSSFGATSNELHLVTSDPTQTNQTTVKLGTFRIPNNIRWLNYLYTPLVDDAGAQPLLNLSGTNTLRLLATGTAGEDLNKAMVNYIMLVQAPISVVSSGTVDGAYTPEGGATVNVAARQVTVPLPVSGASRYYRISSNVAVSIKSIAVGGGVVTLTL